MKCCGIYAYGNRNYQPQDLCKTSNCGNDAWETETVGGNQRRVLLPRSAGRLTPKKTAATLVAAVFVCIICQIRISSGTFKRSYAAFERISLCEMKEKKENACVFQGKAVLLRQ